MEKAILKPQQSEELIQRLKDRFESNMNRHKGLDWKKIETKLKGNTDKLLSLFQMEQTGGEPDVVGYENDQYVFYDCSPESPNGRRSVCYDNEALEDRKKFKPKNSAIGMAKDMGIEILTKQEYMELQKLGEFDLKTSSWLKTPSDIRKLGGAIFGDRRYDTVFIYHNGADSYYGSRGFRSKVLV
jgi:hypothetical protein